jgi:hypothetical protein
MPPEEPVALWLLVPGMPLEVWWELVPGIPLEVW